MASAWGQMEKQEGQGLRLEEGWGRASVSPSTSPFSSLQPLLFLPSASLCLPIPGTLSSGPPPTPTSSLLFSLLSLLPTTAGPCVQRVLAAVSRYEVRSQERFSERGWGGGWRCGDPPIQLTGSDPVPHDHQEGVQVHGGLRALPIGVQAAGQCLEASILGTPSSHGLQVG